MSTVKTAVSLDVDLFEAVSALAATLHISRSKLVALAVEEYVRLHRNIALLDQINEAYADNDDAEDEPRVRSMRRRHAAVLADDAP